MNNPASSNERPKRQSAAKPAPSSQDFGAIDLSGVRASTRKAAPTKPAPTETPQDASLPVKFKLQISLQANNLDGEGLQAFTEALASTRLPRPRVGDNYQAPINLGAVLRQSAPRVQDAIFSNLRGARTFERHGLQFRLGNNVLTISGKPTQTVAGTLELKFVLGDASVGSVSLPFTIHPDLWSLWKELPSPSGPYAEGGDYQEQGMRFPGTDKFILAASRRGRSHEHRGQFRDDSFNLKLGPSGSWSFFAVADGAGSAKFSREGARIACQTVVHQLSVRLNEALKKGALQEPLRDLPALRGSNPDLVVCDGTQAPLELLNVFHYALYDTYMRIRKTYEAHNANLAPGESPAQLSDFHTTLLCCAVRKYQDDWLIFSYWCGDGAFAIYGPNGQKSQVIPLGEPDGGEFAGQTRFFTTKSEIDREPIQRRFRAVRLRDFDALVMMTDGVSDPNFEVAAEMNDPTRWASFWNQRGKEELFHNVFTPGIAPKARSEALLEGLRFKVQDNHDDRTLMLLLNPKSFEAPNATRR